MTRTDLTAESIARAIWGCAASDIAADGSVTGITADGRVIDVYPDPAGHSVCFEAYTDREVRGWFAARLAGDEKVSIEDSGNLIRFVAAPLVLGRIGNGVSGREAARLRAALRREG